MNRRTAESRRRFDVRFALLTLAYAGVVYWLSSIPDLSIREQHPLIRLMFNLGHVPIFAGLTFCILKALPASPPRYATAFGAALVVGLLDEWHQSFVPGRNVSSIDLLLDLAGSAAVLLIVHGRPEALGRRCEAE